MLRRQRPGGLWFEASSLQGLISTNKLGVVVHICNSRYTERLGKRITVPGQH
jgi:hypothetical protein